jgi:hypothetical protein
LNATAVSVWTNWFGPAFATGGWFAPPPVVVLVVDVLVVVVDVTAPDDVTALTVAE